jgi:hypothetical protein
VSAADVRADEAGDELGKFGRGGEKISEVVEECGQGRKGQAITERTGLYGLVERMNTGSYGRCRSGRGEGTGPSAMANRIEENGGTIMRREYK